MKELKNLKLVLKDCGREVEMRVPFCAGYARTLSYSKCGRNRNCAYCKSHRNHTRGIK